MVIKFFLMQNLVNKLTIAHTRQKGDKTGFSSGYFSRYTWDKSRFFPPAREETGFYVFSESKPTI